MSRDNNQNFYKRSNHDNYETNLSQEYRQEYQKIVENFLPLNCSPISYENISIDNTAQTNSNSNYNNQTINIPFFNTQIENSGCFTRTRKRRNKKIEKRNNKTAPDSTSVDNTTQTEPNYNIQTINITPSNNKDLIFPLSSTPSLQPQPQPQPVYSFNSPLIVNNHPTILKRNQTGSSKSAKRRQKQKMASRLYRKRKREEEAKIKNQNKLLEEQIEELKAEINHLKNNHPNDEMLRQENIYLKKANDLLRKENNQLKGVVNFFNNALNPILKDIANQHQTSSHSQINTNGTMFHSTLKRTNNSSQNKSSKNKADHKNDLTL